MTATSYKHDRKVIAVLAVLLTLAVLFAPMSTFQSTDAASDEIYTYSLSKTDLISGYTPIGSSSDGAFTSIDNTNSGSWTWDSDGYGPFNSFYAAFDPAQNNRMICHLDPDDLSESVDGSLDITDLGYNVMWVLPTVYWYTDGTNLMLTNDPDSGGVAYAHTIDGHVYRYLALGVYEGSESIVNGVTTITSSSGKQPLYDMTLSENRELVSKQGVDTDGEGSNGQAMIWNFFMMQLYRFCCFTVIDSYDSQAVVGMGADSVFTTTGELDESGPYAGIRGSPEEFGNGSVKLFIENSWGSGMEFVDGIFGYQGSFYVNQSSEPDDSLSGQYVSKLSIVPYNGGSNVESNLSSNADSWGFPVSRTGAGRIDLGGDQWWTNKGSNQRMYMNFGGSGCRETCGINNFNQTWTDTSHGSASARLALVFDDDMKPTVTVNYVSNGDVLESQILAQGSTTVSPNDPILYGYTFKGWFLDDGTFLNEFDFTTPITNSITLYAKWEGNLKFTTDPVSDGAVTAIEGQPGTVSFRATDSLYYSSVLWDFGDGTTSTDLYATHYYSEPGTYTASLTVYNNHGSDVTTYRIEVPSAEPGGDGTEWALVAAVVLIAFVSGALIARRLF